MRYKHSTCGDSIKDAPRDPQGNFLRVQLLPRASALIATNSHSNHPGTYCKIAGNLQMQFTKVIANPRRIATKIAS